MSQLYSKKLIDIFTNPKNIGKLKNSNAVGAYQSPVCGDMLTIYLKIKNNKIINASFETFGCMVSVGVSSIVTELAKNKTLDQALKITKKDVAQAIGQIPPVKEHCLEMSIQALKNAIQNFKHKKI
ncbi:MAG: iron-sulfur cluster assembly scaffold protein [bacterium]